MSRFVLISQLALGDAVIAIKFLAVRLVDQGDTVTVICNKYNANLFDGFTTIIEDWPISKRRFFSTRQFRFLWARNILSDDCVILVPSGNFIEKVISLIRFRHFKKKGMLFTARILYGMRGARQNYLIGNYFKFDSDIEIQSRDAYGAHVEYFHKSNYLLGKNTFPSEFLNRFQRHMKINNLQHVILQVSSLHRKKHLPLHFVKFLLAVIKASNFKLSILSDKSGRPAHAESLRSPQWFANKGVYDDCFLVLQDSFLMHHVAEKSKNVFMWIGESNSYEWTPKDVKSISSIYSLCYMLDS